MQRLNKFDADANDLQKFAVGSRVNYFGEVFLVSAYDPVKGYDLGKRDGPVIHTGVEEAELNKA